MSCKVHKERPSRGKGRLAWDSFIKNKGYAPFSVEYSHNYDHQFKGWVCEHFEGHVDIHGGHYTHKFHTFYLSSELK